MDKNVISNPVWLHSKIHNTTCKVLEEQVLWGKAVCRIWLPSSDAVVKVPKESLQAINLDPDTEIETARICYVASAAKIADVLETSVTGGEGPVLLAPMDSKVIPLPHQIHALSRAITNDRVRYLLADEVGLGKTIEAGLILRELKLRGLVKRTLVVSPKGIATQWISEMQTHFNERFEMILGEDLKTLQRISETRGGQESISIATPWTLFDQVVVSLDSVKPMDRRQGWSEEKIKEYNNTRFENLVTAGWDLIIVDEAHRLGGSTDLVARYKLGKGLAEAAPYFLLLSATPHQGKTDAFHRLIGLLDETTFPDIESITRERVAPFVIRTEKRNAVDADGNSLFRPRRTLMFPVRWEPRHHLQEQLYEAVTDYVREGYNQAILEENRHIGFLMILMQRLVVSSTRAIRTTLEKRLAIVQDKFSSLENINHPSIPDMDPETIHDLDAQELLDELISSRMTALENEASQVELLLKAARESEQSGVDAKAEGLIDWIYRLQSEENESDLKVLIFTEFIPTQQMLQEFLEDRGFSVCILNGSMDMALRKQAQETFRDTTRILISTDAGGEGLNLQFCHVIINYDLPWNPMRIEQRIGRVDRIGQPKVVRAINFVFENSVEFRVREVLEQKLSIIYEEFGIDKTGDILDSAKAGEIFEDIFTSALLNPEKIDSTIDHTMAEMKTQMDAIREVSAVYSISEKLDIAAAQRLQGHPLPFWIEKMVLSYLAASGGTFIKKKAWWELNWPDNTIIKKAVFNSNDAITYSGTTLLNLEDPKVKGIAVQIPQILKSTPIPCVEIDDLPINLEGAWGLFEIRISTTVNFQNSKIRIPFLRKGFICIFSTPEGKIYLPTARHIWDTLSQNEPSFKGFLSPESSIKIFDQLEKVAESVGQEIFNGLHQDHLNAIEKERERGEYFYQSRQKAIELIGLPEVRQYRLRHLEKEKSEWKADLKAAASVIPEIRPLLLLNIGKKGGPDE